MNQVHTLEVAQILPTPEQVLRQLGVPPGKPVSPKVQGLVQEARDLLTTHCRPVGLSRELSRKAFAPLFAGEGENAEATPLEGIYPRAENLALYALTLGRELCALIPKLFTKHDFALGSVLDAVASLAAEGAVRALEQYFSRAWQRNHGGANLVVLSYSPGYCGWHISGQKKIFEFLHPEEIGLRLNANYLMEPLKSVTGLLVAGPAELHAFPAHYPFCTSCREATCQERMKRIPGPQPIEEKEQE